MSTKQGEVVVIEADEFRARVREAAESLNKDAFRKWLVHHEQFAVNMSFEPNDAKWCPLATYLWVSDNGMQDVSVCPDQYRFKRDGDKDWTRKETPAWAREFIETWDRIGSLTDKSPKAARVVLDELISQGF